MSATLPPGSTDRGTAASPTPPTALARWLAAHPAYFTVFASVAAFGAYTCMYAFRRPFTVGTYEGFRIGQFDLKVLLVVGQMIGYSLSKFTGIKVVTEAPASRRLAMIALLIGGAFATLVLFPLVPHPLQPVCLFFNGLPLGMIWGLVFSFLEGRRVTEFLGLGLSVSFIFASGWTKSAGKLVMKHWGVSEFWMPAVTGLVFVPLLLLCLWMLAQIPPPDRGDEADCTSRQPMDRAARRRLMRELGAAIWLLTGAYLLLSVYRDLRDTYMADVLKELGHPVADSGVFARIETAVGCGVLAALAWLWFIRSHWRALRVYYWVIGLGAVLVGVATWAFRAGYISPVTWLTLTGLGGYLGYVPFNSILFDRLLAATRRVGTATFLIYIADSSAYLAIATLYLGRSLLKWSGHWTGLVVNGGYAVAVAVPLALALGWICLRRQFPTAPR